MSRHDLLEKIRDAAKVRGAVTELARALGLSRGAIYYKLKQEDGFTEEQLKKAAVALVVAGADRILKSAELPGGPADTKLLINCIVAVEELLDEMGSRPPHEAKAEVIAKIFALECERQRAGEGGVSGSEIVRMVRSA